MSTTIQKDNNATMDQVTCQSLNFILVIKSAIRKDPKHWKAYLELGLRCIRFLPLENRAFALSELAISIVNIDLTQSKKLALSAMDHLKSSRSDLFLITAQNIVVVLSRTKPPALEDIESVLQEINTRNDVSPINKISTLIAIARIMKEVSLRISKTALILAANLIRCVPIFERFEAEGIVSAGIYDMFNDDLDGAIDLYPVLPSDARVPYRRALVRILQKIQNKPFYELDLSPIIAVYPKLGDKIKDILSQKENIRTKIKKKLEDLDDKDERQTND